MSTGEMIRNWSGEGVRFRFLVVSIGILSAFVIALVLGWISLEALEIAQGTICNGRDSEMLMNLTESHETGFGQFRERAAGTRYPVITVGYCHESMPRHS